MKFKTNRKFISALLAAIMVVTLSSTAIAEELFVSIDRDEISVSRDGAVGVLPPTQSQIEYWENIEKTAFPSNEP
ncbi:MAG: hypothetical protein FWF76_00105 [Oscillospiraceae bacterium]|nr:hypothetical protein [Oscillospiraceae bacterium]